MVQLSRQRVHAELSRVEIVWSSNRLWRGVLAVEMTISPCFPF
jgi:hypothetical protein